MSGSRAIRRSAVVCMGCGLNATGVYPFRCAAARSGDDIDHVIARLLAPDGARFPVDPDPNPFIRYRTLLRSHHVAVATGMADDEWVAMVRDLDAEIARLDGGGFRETPFGRDARLSTALGFSDDGGVLVKDETGNVSGSHKGRHLFGIMLYLRAIEHARFAVEPLPPLAIASCGNAALAAAVVARAAGRELRVFIPPDAPASTVSRLKALGAHLAICRREPGTTGDPCYYAFQRAIDGGALPFCCQGNENGLTIEGGETLGYEMVSALGATHPDAVVVQVGGGALASAVAQAFLECAALGAIARVPRLYTVQTAGAYPLKRAYDRLIDWMTSHHESADTALRYAAAHRSQFMWPWEQEPRSIAHGILDDETYDWHAVVKGMVESGGTPVVASEEELRSANELANAGRDAIAVDPTGSAGLAGLRQLLAAGAIQPSERVAIIFSGARRD